MQRFMLNFVLTLWTLLLVPLWLPETAAADPALRTQIDLRGNFVMFGANLVLDCASGTPAPTVGTIGNCPDNNLAAPDIYWRSDDPSAGSARADSNITSASARATSMLVLPAGAQVAYARLYWGGLLPSNSPDMQVQLQRVEDGVDETVVADDETAALGAVLELDAGAELFGEILLEALNIGILARGGFGRGLPGRLLVRLAHGLLGRAHAPAHLHGAAGEIGLRFL